VLFLLLYYLRNKFSLLKILNPPLLGQGGIPLSPSPRLRLAFADWSLLALSYLIQKVEEFTLRFGTFINFIFIIKWYLRISAYFTFRVASVFLYAF